MERTVEAKKELLAIVSSPDDVMPHFSDRTSDLVERLARALAPFP